MSRRFRLACTVRGLSILAGVCGIALAWSAPAMAVTVTVPPSAPTTTVPTLSIAMTAPVLVETSPGLWSATILLSVGTSCPPPLSYWLLLPSGTAVPAVGRPAITGTGSCPTPVDQVTPIIVTVRDSFATPPATVTLVVGQFGEGRGASTLSTGAASTSIQLTTQRNIPLSLELFWPALGAGLFAVALVLLVLWRSKVANDRRRESLEKGEHMLEASKLPASLKDIWVSPIYASAAWTFKDSWASNITAVGALLATFLTVSGGVASLLPGVPLYRFAILNAASGGLIVVAPLAIGIVNHHQGTIWQRDAELPKDETMVAPAWGVLLAALITAFGVGTELAFLGVLVQLSAASSGWRDALVVLTAGASAVVLAYSVFSTRTLFLTSWLAKATAERHFPHGSTVTTALSLGRETSFTL